MRKWFAFVAALVGATVVAIGASRAADNSIDPMDDQRACCSEARIDQLSPQSSAPRDRIELTAPIAPRLPRAGLNPQAPDMLPDQPELDVTPTVPDADRAIPQ